MILHLSDRHIGHVYRVTAQLEVNGEERDRLRLLVPKALREPLRDLDSIPGLAAYLTTDSQPQKVDLSLTPVTLDDLLEGVILESNDLWKTQQVGAMLEFLLNRAIRTLRRKASSEKPQDQPDFLTLKVSKTYGDPHFSPPL